MPDYTDMMKEQCTQGLPAVREQRATRAMFFIAGFATAGWAALVPFAKLNTGVNDGTLGLLLLCLGVGALIAMPLTGHLTTRFGCRAVLIISTLLFSLILPLLAVLPETSMLALALLVFGMGMGTTDCAMNVQAILVEKSADKPIMSGFHGFYSLGGIAGAGAMSGMMSAGVSPLYASIAIAAVSVLLLITHISGLLTYANPAEGPVFALPRGAVLTIGAICFAVFLAEGTVLDWSAVFLSEHRAMPEAISGLGFACFAAAMTVGRLTGDIIVSRFGRYPVVITGAMVAAAGLAIAVFVPYWGFSLAGYLLIGIGCANIVPVMFSAIGRQQSMPQAVAVPAVTTLGYMGVLSGPAIVGFVAHVSTLSTAFLFIALLLLAVAALCHKVNM
ncbi:MFS transporter [Nissabacter archeti]|nr:MFS transporter [Nissabacter archeti]